MCGICGIYMKNGETVDAARLKKMADSIRHRGPDHDGFYIHQNIGLGHRRLSIIDRVGGSQPIFNETDEIAIVFNGEIYNHHSLREYLISKGHIFQTRSDTEVIIHLYEEFELNFVSKLRGMFAIAIWDNRSKQLILARDRVGIKPLLYSINNEGIFFASEMKSLLAAEISHTISPISISDYLTYRYVPAPNTIFQEIQRLPPGYILVANSENVRTQQYWDLDCTIEHTESFEKIQEKILNLLKESISLHLESEVPLGAFLSGGVDSSAVVALMAQEMKQPIKTYTIGFTDKNFDESEYAKIISTRYNTEHHSRMVASPQPQELDILLKYFDEPFADSSSLPTYLVCREAAENITVVLSGDGGDENFGGYRRYYYDVLENKIRNFLPNFIRKFLIRPVAWIYPKADWLPQVFRAKTLLTNLCQSPAEAYYSSISSVPEHIKQQILSQDLQNIIQGYRSFEKFDAYYRKANCTDLFRKISYTDFKMYLSGDILTKVDLASMAHSLEVRVPILDHLVIEYAFGIPTNMKIHRTGGKHIFKQALSKFIDYDILYRKKMGFSIPLESWLRKDLAKMFENQVLNGEHLPYFNYNAIRKLFTQHLSGIANHQESLWNLWVFHRWYEFWAK